MSANRDNSKNRVNPARRYDDADCNKGGPSGNARHRRVLFRVGIRSDVLSSDEESVNRVGDTRESVAFTTFSVIHDCMNPKEVIVLSTSDEDEYNTTVPKKILTTTDDRVNRSMSSIKKIKRESKVDPCNDVQYKKQAGVCDKCIQTSPFKDIGEMGESNAKRQRTIDKTGKSNLANNIRKYFDKRDGKISKSKFACRNTKDLACQAKINPISVKLINNKDSKLVAEAHKMNRLVQDSATDDEDKSDTDDEDNSKTDDEDTNDNETRMESIRNNPRNAGLENSSNVAVEPTGSSKSRNCCIHIRRSYTHTETKEIIKYLIKTNSISRAKGRKIFVEMSRYEPLSRRTPMSLYNRFQKILPHIERWTDSLKLRPDIVQKFKELQIAKTRTKL